MTREELKANILSKLDTQRKQWGVLCNEIQDVAYKHISTKDWNAYCISANKDFKTCDGSDFLCMNGHFWDWKEFDSSTVSIVSAFLDYFGAEALNIINQNL